MFQIVYILFIFFYFSWFYIWLISHWNGSLLESLDSFLIDDVSFLKVVFSHPALMFSFTPTGFWLLGSRFTCLSGWDLISDIFYFYSPSIRTFLKCLCTERSDNIHISKLWPQTLELGNPLLCSPLIYCMNNLIFKYTFIMFRICVSYRQCDIDWGPSTLHSYIMLYIPVDFRLWPRARATDILKSVSVKTDTI